MANLNWYNSRVTKIINETSTTKRFFIKIENLTDFQFKPGQFVTLDLPIHEKKNKRWRSYSIASWPNGTNEFELIIVLLDGGLGTHYLFNEIKEGSEILLRGPLGVFTLPENIDRDLVFICTGTGVAPFRSMINYLLHNNITFKQLHLIFGCRKKNDTLYKSEFTELAQKFNSFHYYPCYSREDELAENEYKGYVHPIYLDLIKSEQLQKPKFYLCGWKNMIDDARKNLAEASFDKKDIHFELYG